MALKQKKGKSSKYSSFTEEAVDRFHRAGLRGDEVILALRILENLLSRFEPEPLDHGAS